MKPLSNLWERLKAERNFPIVNILRLAVVLHEEFSLKIPGIFFYYFLCQFIF